MNLDIVVVTYDRLEKLKNTLFYYSDQTKAFRNLIIVNNCSSDGTFDFLQTWISDIKQIPNAKFSPILINTEENIGGSGGFYLGQKKAMDLGADWIMVADDDAYPEEHLVENFYNYVDNHDASKYSAICASVWNTQNEIVLHHRDTWILRDGKYYTRLPSRAEDYEKESFHVDFFSYVGTFLNSTALLKYGLVDPKYFIYFDDSEHSMRLNKYGPIIVVPSIKIIHDDSAKKDLTDENVIVSWQDYYFMRNQFHMLLKHLPKVAYHYFWWQVRDWCLGRIIKTPRSRLENIAKWDAFLGRLGKHPIYKPGWKLLKNE